MEGFNAMTKQITIAVFALLLLITTHLVTHHYSYNAGVLEGIKAYHQQCFEVGGYIIGDTGQVVACGGQGTIPKDELKNFKDNV
jgi:hypothetical protein